jgi:formylglycine-generating enzyme required for sulfatase activity
MTIVACSMARAADEAKTGDKTYTDPAAGMEFVRVPGGCYRMGDAFGDGEGDEKPVHEVCVDDFWLGKYEVTVGQFKKFVSGTGYVTEAEKGGGCYHWIGRKAERSKSYNWRSPGFPQDDGHPAACVSWLDAAAFLKWQGIKAGKGMRLPSEAEWEYAAKYGGKDEKYSGGSDMDGVAWHRGNSGGQTHPAGQKKPNGLGIYDMTGNVWEWTGDWYGENYYGISPRENPRENPRGPSGGQDRAFRGGSWLDESSHARVSYRDGFIPAAGFSFGGFRAAFSAR